jgi:hypothetical protein
MKQIRLLSILISILCSAITEQLSISLALSGNSPALKTYFAQAQSSRTLIEARRRAITLRDNYPGWETTLDSCPCTRAAAQANSRFVDATHYFTETYHPGATWEYRTVENAVRTYFSATLPTGSPTLKPGQQCTYSPDGRLITRGPGAGTPDAYSPSVTYNGQGLVSSNSHTFWDVEPFDAGIRWGEYHQTWVPNNANRCPTNFFTIFKTNSSVDTDIPVNRGDRIQFKATGTVLFGIFAGSGSPNGILLPSLEYNYFIDLLHGQLMGRIRQSGMQDLDGWFPIGKGRELVVLAPGVLELAVNDNQTSDNFGKFTIQVKIDPIQ